MVYRNIKREDFDEALKSLGNDPAILEDDISTSHLQTKKHDSWYENLNRKWRELSSQKDSNGNISSPVIIFAIVLIGVFLITLYLTLQIHQLAGAHTPEISGNELKQELKKVQSHINELDELIQDYQIEIMDQFEEIKIKKQVKVDSRGSSHLSKISPDEIELKKWRHLGVGKNREGDYVMLHDGEKNSLFSKNQFVKASWQILDFNDKRTILQGPGHKQIELFSQ